MTALAAVPTVAAARRPIAWLPLGRATLRRHRGLFLAEAVVFLGLVVLVLVGDASIHPAFARYVAAGCVANAFHVPCGTLENTFSDSTDLFSVVLIALHVVPVLLGAFVGAPLVARELESGTFRFTWTQAVGRRRELLVSMSAFAAPVLVGACVLAIVLGPYAHIFEVAGPDSRWTTGIFEASPLVFPAWCLFGLCLGVLAGTVIGRVVAAMAVSTAVLGAASLFSFQFVRRLFAIAPAVRRVPGSSWIGLGSIARPALRGEGMAGSWLVSSWITGPAGQRLDAGSTQHVSVGFASSKLDPGAWLAAHHFGYFVSYQAPSRYWLFQGTECALLLLLSAIAVVVVLGGLRRRA